MLRHQVKFASRALAAGLLVLGSTALVSAADAIRIGAPLSLTGTLADEGAKEQQGLDMCIDAVNAKGGVKLGADSRPIATSAASSWQAARTARRAWVRSARRPPNGPETSRIAVPAANSIPSCSGASPRPSKNAGMNGEETPNAAYMSA